MNHGVVSIGGGLGGFKAGAKPLKEGRKLKPGRRDRAEGNRQLNSVCKG